MKPPTNNVGDTKTQEDKGGEVTVYENKKPYHVHVLGHDSNFTLRWAAAAFRLAAIAVGTP